MSKQSICLNMIVKNESKIIKNTLENLCSYINFDYWVISDTGSTDSTPDIIKSFFNSKNILGELIHNEWQDFGTNRTMALKAAYNKTDYLFIFDADDKIHGEFKISNNLDKDSYFLKFGPNPTYFRKLLVNNRINWIFKGILHEYIECEKLQKISEDFIQGNYYIESGRIGARNNDPNKYLNDAKILDNEFNKETSSM